MDIVDPVPLPHNRHLPPEYAQALEEYGERAWLPPTCRCAVIFTAGLTAERIPHPDCTVPDLAHQDHRRNP